MSSPATAPSGSAPKSASLAIAGRATLAGIRAAYGFVAGKASTAPGVRGAAYNYVFRPLRATLAPNLGRKGNFVRRAAMAYGAGAGVAHANDELGRARSEFSHVASNLPEEARERIRERLTWGGAAKAVARTATGIGRGAVGTLDRIADDTAFEAARSSIGKAFLAHRDKTRHGETMNSFLNPLGSRAFSSIGTKVFGDGKFDPSRVAGAFGDSYKKLLSSYGETGRKGGA